MKNNIETIRISINARPEDYQKFRELCDKHGFTINSAMTKVFYKAIQVMEENQPLWKEIKQK